MLQANVLIRNMLIRRREQRDGLISPPCCSISIQLAACGQGGVSSKCINCIRESGVAFLAVLSSRAVYSTSKDQINRNASLLPHVYLEVCLELAFKYMVFLTVFHHADPVTHKLEIF